jgi:magnesium chelatase family protein
MTPARTRTVAVTTIDGHVIEVEADVVQGLPATILTGLSGTALREARDRIRAAIVNSGELWPDSKIIIDLYPASLPKRGSAYDLAIAIAVLAASGELPALPEDALFQAELGLDGRLRPVPGVLPAVLAAADRDIRTVIVPTANYPEATTPPDMHVIAADNLRDVVSWLRGGPSASP